MVKINFSSDTDESHPIPNDFLLGQIEDALIYGGGKLLREPLDVFGVYDYFESKDLKLDMASRYSGHNPHALEYHAYESGVFDLNGTELEYFFVRKDVAQKLKSHRCTSHKKDKVNPLFQVDTPLNESLDLEMSDEEVREYLLESVQEYLYGLNDDIDNLLQHVDYLDRNTTAIFPIDEFDELEEESSNPSLASNDENDEDDDEEEGEKYYDDKEGDYYDEDDYEEEDEDEDIVESLFNFLD